MKTFLIFFFVIFSVLMAQAQEQEQKISHDSIPAQIDNILHNKYHKYKVLQAYKIQTNGVVQYKIETLKVVSEAKEINLILLFDEKGKVLNKDKKVTLYFGLDSQKKPVKSGHGHSH